MQVAEAVARMEADLGPVTAVMHGAGRNEPAALFSLTEDAGCGRGWDRVQAGAPRAALASVAPQCSWFTMGDPTSVGRQSQVRLHRPF